MKKGIYRTVDGGSAFVSGPKAINAFDLDSGQTIPLSEVTVVFIRKAEHYDYPSYYNSK